MNKPSHKLQNIVILLVVALAAGVPWYFLGKKANYDQEASLFKSGGIIVSNKYYYSWANGKCYYNWEDDDGNWNSQVNDITKEKDCHDIAPGGGSVDLNSQIISNSGSTGTLANDTTVGIETWWPAGSGFCYKRGRNQWGGYWYLGEISGLKCADILMPNRINDLDILIKQNALQFQNTAPALPVTKSN